MEKGTFSGKRAICSVKKKFLSKKGVIIEENLWFFQKRELSYSFQRCAINNPRKSVANLELV